MSLKIVTYPNPLLGKPSLPITEVTDEIRKLAEEMTEAMYKSDGIGIAVSSSSTSPAPKSAKGK